GACTVPAAGVRGASIRANAATGDSGSYAMRPAAAWSASVKSGAATAGCSASSDAKDRATAKAVVFMIVILCRVGLEGLAAPGHCTPRVREANPPAGRLTDR